MLIIPAAVDNVRNFTTTTIGATVLALVIFFLSWPNSKPAVLPPHAISH
jgi:hypothetical protein